MTERTPPVDTWSDRSTPARIVDLLALGATAGMVTGIVHALVLAVTWFGFGQTVWFSRQFVWMAPVAYTLLLAPGVLPLAATALRIRSHRLFAFTTWGVTATGVFGLLLPLRVISRVAALILAVGFGVQAARLVNAAPVVWAGRFRGAARASLGMVAVLALLPGLSRGIAERRAMAALPPVAADAPNVLLIILDTVRAASMSLYGAAEETTPRLAIWARDGAMFEWAFSVAPWTLPSHASMFTGRYAGELALTFTAPLGPDDSTMAEAFAARGYITGGFVGNLNYTAWDSGLDRGFAHYEDYPVNWSQLWRSSSWTQTAAFDTLLRVRAPAALTRTLLHPDLSIEPVHRFEKRSATDVAARFLEWQRTSAHQQRPFFAFLNFFDAHQPYNAPPPFRQFHSASRPTDAYHSAILYLDATVDGVLNTLRERGVLDNTIVVVASDHGELFNEHGLSGHAHNLYRNVLHVPLIIRFPNRVPANRRIREVVSLRDLPATIVDLAGLPVTTFPGRTLATTWGPTAPAASSSVSAVFAEVTGPPNVDPTLPTGRGPLRAVIGEDRYYIRGPRREEALFDYRADVLERTNLALRPDSALLLAPWRARLDSLLQAHRPAIPPP